MAAGYCQRMASGNLLASPASSRLQAERALEELLREALEMLKEPQTYTQTRGLSQAIQSLPPELRERILKEFIAVKIEEKFGVGFGEVHEELLSVFRNRIMKKICEKNEMGWFDVHEELSDHLEGEMPDFIEIKINQKLSMGWDDVHEEFLEHLGGCMPDLINIKINKKIWMGWQDVHEELLLQPFCTS